MIWNLDGVSYQTQSSARHPSNLAEVCHKCGCSFISNAKYCVECGEKQAEQRKIDPMGDHIFKGTRRTIMGQGASQADALADRDFEVVVTSAKAHHLPLDEVRWRMKEFQKLDVNGNGNLSLDEFMKALRLRCGIPDEDPIPTTLVNQSWLTADRDRSGCLNFEEFLLWSLRTEYDEALVVADPREKELRRMAREKGISLPDADRIRELFDRFNISRSGELVEEEFKSLVLTIMNVRNRADMSELRLRRFWREIDTDRSGTVSFKEFLTWYLACIEGNDWQEPWD